MAYNPRSAVLPIPLPFDMVSIPAGPFLMGSESGDERPQHEVALPAYYIGRYPVTKVQYDACRKNKRLRLDQFHPSSGSEIRPHYPQVFVSWKQALAYCRWLEKTYHLPFRLPSEAEWEKAARGADGRVFPWGEVADPGFGNFDNKVGFITPVDGYPKGTSPYGVLDMAGNALEWTSSLYRPYPYETTDGREDLSVSGDRVLRGGCYNRSPMVARCASRIHASPDSSHDYFGLRVALSPQSILAVVEDLGKIEGMPIVYRNLGANDPADDTVSSPFQTRKIEPLQLPPRPNMTELDLSTKLGELQRRYDTLSKRIHALDTDIGRALKSVDRQALGEQRDEFAADRERTMLEIEALQGQLRE